MIDGGIFRSILFFSIPLLIGNFFQQLYNTVDSYVVGNFVNTNALAAVGTTGTLINLLVGFFVGVSSGATVIISQFFGAGDGKNVSKAVHTSIALALAGGLIIMVLGLLTARPSLVLLGVPEEILGDALTYMNVYYCGIIASMIYNVGTGVLRAIGDSRMPLYVLIVCCLVNIVLDLLFVLGFHWGVFGVAIATVLSQVVSAVLIMARLMLTRESYRVELKRIRFDKSILKNVIRIGLPAGMQGAIFSISNVLIQSSVNSFGSIAMAGNTASSNVEGFVYTAMNAVYQTNLSFTSQNLGGGKYARINRTLYICLGVVTGVGIALGAGAVLGGRSLLHIYSSDPEVIRYGMLRMTIICSTYFLCGIMDCMVGSLRGMGYSVVPMFVSLAGACGFRVIWVFTVFAAYRSLDVLYISYPVSWAITAAAHMLTFRKIRRRYPKVDL